ncbi:hypothetical protein [Nocardia caishijiensis]|nr:hypothetical protein [Nocardia caishijiensis]
MVQLLIHLYPTARAQLRGTIDADTGVSTEIAASQHFHDRLLERNYVARSGNNYELEHDGQGKRAVDILVPLGAPGTIVEIGGRGFDHGPGLSLALSAPPLHVRAQIRLTDGQHLEFVVPTPDIEPAVALKALAWRSRRADKDLTDLASLFEIVQEHRTSLGRWRLNQPPLHGIRLDTARALSQLCTTLDRGSIARTVLLGQPPARLATLIRAHVTLP